MADLLKSFERIKDLRRTADDLRGILPKYEKICKEPSCDKHGLAFAGDDRFAIFDARIGLHGYHGYYGNSSCSTFATIPEKYAYRFLAIVLNRNMKLILEGMADEAEKEANSLREEAKKELKEAERLLEDLTA